jgi:hypothetical protein
MSQKEIIQRLRENHEYIEHGELELRKARREQKELTAALLGLAKKEVKK